MDPLRAVVDTVSNRKPSYPREQVLRLTDGVEAGLDFFNSIGQDQSSDRGDAVAGELLGDVDLNSLCRCDVSLAAGDIALS